MGRRLLLLLCLFGLFLPLYWLLVGAVANGSTLSKIPPDFYPREPTLVNFRALLTSRMLPIWLANTIILVCAGGGAGTLSVLMAGFALATRPKGWRIIVGCLIASIVVPRNALVIPMYVEIVNLGLGGRMLGAALPLFFAPALTLIAMTFFRGIPQELFEEARLSGASDIDLLRYIAIPNCGPILGLVTLSKGVEALGDYLWQSLVLHDQKAYTFIVAIMERTNNLGVLVAEAKTGSLDGYAIFNPVGLQCAAGVLIFLPFLLVYSFTARYFTQDPLKGLR